MRFLAEAKSCADSIQISCEYCFLKISYWAEVILATLSPPKETASSRLSLQFSNGSCLTSSFTQTLHSYVY
jgi:hypothetical protein